MSDVFSLTPGFSPVQTSERGEDRFNGFSATHRPLKRLALPGRFHIRLKPGVDNISEWLPVSANLKT